MATIGDSYDAGLFWVNQNDFDGPGDEIPYHKHKIPHTTDVKFGDFEISLRWPDGRVETYPRTQFDMPVHVPALVEHRILCVKGPGRTRCMFNHYTPLGGITDRFMGVRFQKPADDEYPADNQG